MDVHAIIGRNVRRARRAAGIEYEDFARLLTAMGLETSGATVLRLETGKRGVKVDELLVLAYVLGTSPFALVDPGADEVDVVEGVSLDGKALGDWWLTLTHPDEDVSDSAMDAQRPAALRGYFDGLRVVVEENRTMSAVMDLLERKGLLVGGSADLVIDATSEEQSNA